MISYSLLETMRLERGRIVRLERHLDRMASSARHFGFVWDDAAVRRVLATQARSHPDGSWRSRLLVSSTGTPTVECTPYTADAQRTWRVAFARTPVNQDDPFLRHKTTNREVYEEARRERPDVDDVLLWNPRGEVTEATIANLVAEIDAVRYTPPVSCGLLGGMFRAELLESGAIGERVLTKPAIVHATRLWLINSLREWIDVALVE